MGPSTPDGKAKMDPDMAMDFAAPAVLVAAPSEASDSATLAHSSKVRIAHSDIQSVAPSGSSSTPTKPVGTEDVRSMTPHQKADYWHNLLCVVDTMLDKQDRRPIRQGTDLVFRNSGTSDPSLKFKLEELSAKLGQVALAERLTPAGLLKCSDDDIVEALDVMMQLEVQLPPKVQLGLVTRRLRQHEGDLDSACGAFRVLVPWRVDLTSAGDCDSIFDCKKPTVFSTGVDEEEKIKFFSDWVSDNLLAPALEQAPPAADKLIEVCKALLRDTVVATEDADDLSDGVAAVVYDCVSCLRGVAALLQRHLTVDILVPSIFKSVGLLRTSKHRASSTNICYKIALFIAKDVNFTGNLLKEFTKHEPAFMESRADIEQAFFLLDGLQAEALGSGACHASLQRLLPRLKEWEAKLRPGATKALQDLARSKCADHFAKCLAPPSLTGASDAAPVKADDLLSLVRVAISVWPLAGGFEQTQVALMAKGDQDAVREVHQELDAECQKLAAALSPASKSLVVLDEALLSSFKATVKSAIEPSCMTPPASAEGVVNAALKALNSKAAWASPDDTTQLMDVAQLTLDLWGGDGGEQKTYFSNCLRVLASGVRALRAMKSLGDLIGKEGTTGTMLLKGLPLVVACLRATERLKLDLAQGVALPSVAGDWERASGVVLESQALLGSAKDMLATSSQAAFEQNVYALGSVCCGGASDNELWSQGLAASDGAIDPATWAAATKELISVDIKQLDQRIAEVKARRDDCDTVCETFGEHSDEVAVLRATSVKSVQRAELTKVEGAIVYICDKFLDDDVARRNKLAQQRNKLKQLGAGAEAQIHPKIKDMLKAGMSFM